MTPLDLRRQPPRSPIAELDGLVFLPRTLDKARGLLTGGSLGAYAMHGFSEMMLATVGVNPLRFIDTVRAATCEADVVGWMRERADTTQYARWNEWLLSRKIEDDRHRGRVALIYPAATDPALVRIVDVLVADDAASFAYLARDAERVAS